MAGKLIENRAKAMWWTVVFLLANTGLAAPFAKYRAELSAPAERARLAKKATAQIMEARKGLGTEAIQYPSFSTGAFLDLKRSREINGNKLTSSGILKLRLGRLNEELRKRGPLPFEDGNSRYAFCEKTVGKEYPLTVNELLHEHLKSVKVQTASSSATALEFRLVSELRPLLPSSATQKLGTLAGLDFIDGKITKLFFLTPNGEEYAVTFSLLTAFRTRQDKYFLVTLECLRRHLEIHANDEKPADAEYQSVAKLLLPVITHKLKEGSQIHQRIGTLTTSELHALLDIFLVLQGDDLPAPEELQSPDDPKTWKPGQSPPSFSTLMSQKIDPALQRRNALLIKRQTARANKQGTEAYLADAEADAVMRSIEEPMADYQYYRLFQRQIQELLETLHEEKQRDDAERKLLRVRS